jgi:hypothetical protein
VPKDRKDDIFVRFKFPKTFAAAWSQNSSMGVSMSMGLVPLIPETVPNRVYTSFEDLTKSGNFSRMVDYTRRSRRPPTAVSSAASASKI